MKQQALITGSEGFIGRNLSVALTQLGIGVLPYTRDHSLEDLAAALRKADIIYHLAGVNRSAIVDDFDTGNRLLTEQLLELISASGRSIPLVVSSSIQATLNNPYGVSKRSAEDAVFQWSRFTGNPVFVYRLPNVFGKWSRPNHNSVIATFCHNIARSLPIRIDDPDAVLTLAYVDDVVDEFLKYVEQSTPDSHREPIMLHKVTCLPLKRIVDLLYSFRESRHSMIVPDFADEFARSLYATYLSFLPDDEYCYPLDMKKDSRGWLAEFIKSPHVGQLFVSRTRPGVTRGNHWHRTKVEKFLVVQGEATVVLRQVGGCGLIEYAVSDSVLHVVDIPPGYTHAITNIGTQDLVTVFWADELFDMARPDTYYLEV